MSERTGGTQVVIDSLSPVKVGAHGGQRISASTVNGFGGYRLALALAVLWMHNEKLIFGHPTGSWLEPFEIGSVAVLCFFTLSGFVIVNAIEVHYKNRPSAFLQNRLNRVVPAFVVVILLSLVVLAPLSHAGRLTTHGGLPAPADAMSLGNIARNLLELVPFANKFANPPYKFVPIAWAVRTELMFYLAAWGLLAASSYSRLASFARLGAITSAVFLTLAAIEITTGSLHFPTFRVSVYFILGASIFYFLNYRSWTSLALIAASLPIAAFETLSRPGLHETAGFSRHLSGQLLLLCTLVALFSLLAWMGPRRSSLNDFFGELSYPVYLGHMIPLNFVVSLGALSHPSWIWWSAALLGTTIISLFLVFIVERPVARLRNMIRCSRAPAIS